MSATKPSQYVEVLITPLDNSLGLAFRVQSKQLPLTTLPGKKRIHVTLTQGSFADVPEQGGTGREEGYTGFDLAEPAAGSAEFTLKIENLQPVGTSQLIQGMAAVVLEGQDVTLHDSAQQPVVLDVAGALVTLAEVHFVVATLTPQDAFTVRHGAVLATATSKADASTRVCIAFRDNGPLGLDLLPGSRYFIFRAASNEIVPPMDLTFHLPADPDRKVAPGVFIRRQGTWEKMQEAALAADGRSVSVSTTGESTFALSAAASS
ncbi:MAG TPA: hypothetical protein PKM78_10065 [Anaerolineae bacterium]|nr:hypothetical protein [Anaerolineae bacterium]HNU04448.1 hypothetical protein [Anaerolineae bacterium]